MANNSDELRRLMNLMETVQQPTLVEGWVDNLKTKMDRRMGEKERAKMAAELTKEYYTWLGHSKRVGALDDLERFMTHRVGFNDNDIKVVLDQAGLSQPAEKPTADDAEVKPTKAEPAASTTKSAETPASEEKPKEYDAEEGVPIPQDLNTKLSDYKDIGNGVEQTKADNEMDPGEIKDDPRKYQAKSGEWDRSKINDKLSKMPVGAKLTLGKSTFRRVKGNQTATDFIDPRAKTESINEANAQALSRSTIRDVMDAVAAQVNDEYLYNGPERDRDGEKPVGRAAGRASADNSATDGAEKAPTTNKPGKAASGSYDAKEMFNILKVDFEKGETWVNTLTRKVMNAKSISEMADSDMQDLALLGWALVRARN